MILRVRDDDGNIFDIPAIRGLSSYEIAVEHGFEGTEAEWLESIGAIQGKSAFEVAVDDGFDGDVTDWLESLRGPKGDAGPAPAITIGTIETLDPSAKATVTLGGTAENPILSFGIPKGSKGDTGATGATGATPVFTIGTVTTLAAGSSATASISGTAAAPILNLGIPRGDRGYTGATGSSGTSLPSVSTSDNGKFLRVVGGVWAATSISSAEGTSF